MQVLTHLKYQNKNLKQTEKQNKATNAPHKHANYIKYSPNLQNHPESNQLTAYSNVKLAEPAYQTTTINNAHSILSTTQVAQVVKDKASKIIYQNHQFHSYSTKLDLVNHTSPTYKTRNFNTLMKTTETAPNNLLYKYSNQQQLLTLPPKRCNNKETYQQQVPKNLQIERNLFTTVACRPIKLQANNTCCSKELTIPIAPRATNTIHSITTIPATQPAKVHTTVHTPSIVTHPYSIQPQNIATKNTQECSTQHPNLKINKLGNIRKLNPTTPKSLHTPHFKTFKYPSFELARQLHESNSSPHTEPTQMFAANLSNKQIMVNPCNKTYIDSRKISKQTPTLRITVNRPVHRSLPVVQYINRWATPASNSPHPNQIMPKTT
eukprot:gene3545-2496_t